MLLSKSSLWDMDRIYFSTFKKLTNNINRVWRNNSVDFMSKISTNVYKLFSPSADVGLSVASLRLSCPHLPSSQVTLLVRAAVNHFCTVSPVIKLTYVGLRGCVQSQVDIKPCSILCQAAKSSWARPCCPLWYSLWVEVPVQTTSSATGSTANWPMSK